MPQRGARAARGPNSVAGSIRPNGGRLLSSPIMETNASLPARCPLTCARRSRRSWSGGCSPCAASGHAAAPPSSVMNARRLIR